MLLLFADYAPRDSFMITQPDGTSLWLYECGDEDFNWEESTDGYVIIQNAQGVMEYATITNNQVKNNSPDLTGCRCSSNFDSTCGIF